MEMVYGPYMQKNMEGYKITPDVFMRKRKQPFGEEQLLFTSPRRNRASVSVAVLMHRISNYNLESTEAS